MKPQQTVPFIVTAAPAFAAAPPLLFAAAIGLGLWWLLSPKQKHATEQAATEPPAPIPVVLSKQSSLAPQIATLPPKAVVPAPLQSNSHATVRRRITREDVAEALEYGTRPMTRIEAVAKLQALGFQKTAAYKALSPNGKFREMITHTSDGLAEWRG